MELQVDSLVARWFRCDLIPYYLEEHAYNFQVFSLFSPAIDYCLFVNSLQR